ncbi:MAG: MBL fold metallo-hydrolase [Deferrisomatales bacterium]|nr:MBL fold metallo-hydrolase [Deferrisomatales bacterium]
MIFSETGEVVPGFHVLGNAHTPSYLLEAPRPALFDCGFAFLADAYAAHARRVLGGREPELLFLTHVHFDHCGAAAALREAFPGLRTAASARAAEILERPRAVALMASLNEGARALSAAVGVERPSPALFGAFPVDRVLSDGDEVDLGGGIRVQALATPGHTRDFLSYYVPGRRILVASEAVGCAHRSGRIMVEFVADYEAYEASLLRLRALDVEVLCQGHERVYLGRDAREFFDRSLDAARVYRRRVEELLEVEGGDASRVVARIKTEEYDPLPEPKQPEAAYLLNTDARVRLLAARRAAAGDGGSR